VLAGLSKQMYALAPLGQLKMITRSRVDWQATKLEAVKFLKVASYELNLIARNDHLISRRFLNMVSICDQFNPSGQAAIVG
jgi:hypothetical protein